MSYCSYNLGYSPSHSLEDSSQSQDLSPPSPNIPPHIQHNFYFLAMHRLNQSTDLLLAVDTKTKQLALKRFKDLTKDDSAALSDIAGAINDVWNKLRETPYSKDPLFQKNSHYINSLIQHHNSLPVQMRNLPNPVKTELISHLKNDAQKMARLFFPKNFITVWVQLLNNGLPVKNLHFHFINEFDHYIEINEQAVLHFLDSCRPLLLKRLDFSDIPITKNILERVSFLQGLNEFILDSDYGGERDHEPFLVEIAKTLAKNIQEKGFDKTIQQIKTIVETIQDLSKQTLALTEVSKALIEFHYQQSMPFLKQAIQLAFKKLPLPEKSIALAKIATVHKNMQTFATQRAVHFANQIQDQIEKAIALAKIAAILAEISPQQANELLQKGVALAKESNQPIFSLIEIAKFLAQVDFQKGISIIKQIKDPNERTNAFKAISNSLIRRNPKAALQALRQIKDPKQQFKAVADALEILIHIHPQFTIDVVNGIQNLNLRVKLLLRLHVVIPSHNPSTREQVLWQSFQTIKKMTNLKEKADALSKLSQELIDFNPHLSIQLVALIQIPEKKEKALKELAQSLAFVKFNLSIQTALLLQDPHQRVAVLLGIGRSFILCNARKAAHALTIASQQAKLLKNLTKKDQNLAEIATVLAKANLERAFSIAKKITIENIRKTVLPTIEKKLKERCLNTFHSLHPSGYSRSLTRSG